MPIADCAIGHLTIGVDIGEASLGAPVVVALARIKLGQSRASSVICNGTGDDRADTGGTKGG